MEITNISSNMNEREHIGILLKPINKIEKEMENFGELLIVQRQAYGRYIIYSYKDSSFSNSVFDFYDSNSGRIGVELGKLLYELESCNDSIDIYTKIESVFDKLMSGMINVKTSKDLLTKIYEENNYEIKNIEESFVSHKNAIDLIDKDRYNNFMFIKE